MADLEKLVKTINELEIQSNDLKEFNKVYSEIGKLKNEISQNLMILKENNEGFSQLSEKIQARLKMLEVQAEKLEIELTKKIQEIYKDNKQFQKELDSSLITRLEKHKSDIQVELRNEGTQIQRAFETSLNLNFNALELKLIENFKIQSKQINTLKFLLLALIGLCVGLTVGLYLK